MTTRQQLTRLLDRCEAELKQCKKDGDHHLAKSLNESITKIYRELEELSRAEVKALVG